MKKTAQPPAPKTALTPSAKASRMNIWLSLSIVVVAALTLFAAISLAQLSSPAQKNAAPTAGSMQSTAARPSSAGGAVDYCRAFPAFREKLGFGQFAALSTIERGTIGAVMLESGGNGQPQRRYQHPSWAAAGYLGHLIFDRSGNVFTFPAPTFDLDINPPSQQNKIYRIDSVSGVMELYLSLPIESQSPDENPFGVLGLAYDCDTHSLYVSSVAGSTRAKEIGVLYQINLATHSVVSRYDNVDAFGIGIYIGKDGKRFYYGSARTAEVFSIGLDASGDFVGDARLELSLPDASYKARRLIFDRAGKLEVRGYPFDFTLEVASERREKIFTYRYDNVVGTWRLQ